MKTLEILLSRDSGCIFYRARKWFGTEYTRPSICADFVGCVCGEEPLKIKLELSPLPKKGFKQIYFNYEATWCYECGLKRKRMTHTLLRSAGDCLERTFKFKRGITRMYIKISKTS